MFCYGLRKTIVEILELFYIGFESATDQTDRISELIGTTVSIILQLFEIFEIRVVSVGSMKSGLST